MIRKTTLLASTKTAGIVLLGGLLLAMLTTAVQAEIVLRDANSEVVLDATGSAGVSQWIVDGTNFLQKQQWWYRIGAMGPEKTIDQAGYNSTHLSDATGDHIDDTASINYGSQSGVTFDLSYSVRGGEAGNGNSDLAEQMTVVNHGTSSVTLHLYEYAHMNLSLGAPLDTVAFDGSSVVDQNGLYGTAEEVVTQKPRFHEAALFAQTENRLNDGDDDNLNNANVAGPGDPTWAFQWDFTLAAGKSYIISKDKTLTTAVPVPEPSTFALLLIAALALGGFACRGKKAAA